MKKIYLLLIIMTLGAFSFSANYMLHFHNQVETTQRDVTGQTKSRDTVPLDWKTYTNDKLGFTFQYPNTWSKYGEDINVIDLSGTKKIIEIYFVDTVSKTTLLICRFELNETNLYQYALSQYNSSEGLYKKGGKEIEVAGKKAIEAFVTTSINGKGGILNPPESLILVDFLNKAQTGTIELEFHTPLPNYTIEAANFEKLLSTFQYIN